VRAVEFLPLYALLAWEWWTGRAVASPAHQRREARLSGYAGSGGEA
jgi:hypothetical protein